MKRANTLSGTWRRGVSTQRSGASAPTITQASQTPGLCFGASNKSLIPKSAEEAVEKHEKPSPFLQNTLDIYVYHMPDVFCSPYTVQAVRPTCHWWRCPRVLAWFRVRMVLSLVKPPVSAGPLSRIGDYLLAARGPGLFLWAVHSPPYQGDYG